MKHLVKKEMLKAFMKDFRSLLKDARITREATDGTFDPVTETTTGGTNGIDKTVKGLFRQAKGRIVDGVNITNDDTKLTIYQDWLTFVPQENDIVNGSWRVIKVTEDPANVFWNLYLRRAS